MVTVALPPPTTEGALADLLEGLGNVPPERILTKPPLGTATEQDALEVDRRKGLTPELIDGVLVEKTVRYAESRLALILAFRLEEFIGPRKLGWLGGADGPLKILPDQIRVPDLSFISRDQFPSGEMPDVPIPRIAPDLAVEILSRGNTQGEMQRKLVDYFAAGVRLVWYIDPREKMVRVYTTPNQCSTLGEDGLLDGGEVLPGFRLELKELFAKFL